MAQTTSIQQIIAQKEQVAVLGAENAAANEANACGKFHLSG
jgi:hypothetical protein